MRLSAADRAGLGARIDARWDAERSIVLRYAPAVRLHDDARKDAAARALLERNSLGEGARVVPLPEYREVRISVVDETTLMATGTLKAVDGCLTASLLQASGVDRVAFESGGNTGAALTAYCQRAGIETFFFCPSENLDLLDSRLFRPRTAHLVAVRDRRAVKDLAALFAARTGIRRVPPVEWRLGASLFRGLFLVEQLLRGLDCDWLVQAVSAGFGPIGIYRVLQEVARELGPVPRFLAVQQAANAPLLHAWTGGGTAIPPQGPAPSGLLSRVMYDASPQTYGTTDEFQRLLRWARGDVLTLDEGEFRDHIFREKGCEAIPDLLLRVGIPISWRHGAIREKTGLMALAGTLKAVDAGLIAPGSRVLCCLTGGVNDADGLAEPEVVVAGEDDLVRYAARWTRGGLHG